MCSIVYIQRTEKCHGELLYCIYQFRNPSSVGSRPFRSTTVGGNECTGMLMLLWYYCNSKPHHEYEESVRPSVRRIRSLTWHPHSHLSHSHSHSHSHSYCKKALWLWASDGFVISSIMTDDCWILRCWGIWDIWDIWILGVVMLLFIIFISHDTKIQRNLRTSSSSIVVIIVGQSLSDIR